MREGEVRVRGKERDGGRIKIILRYDDISRIESRIGMNWKVFQRARFCASNGRSSVH